MPILDHVLYWQNWCLDLLWWCLLLLTTLNTSLYSSETILVQAFTQIESKILHVSLLLIAYVVIYDMIKYKFINYIKWMIKFKPCLSLITCSYMMALRSWGRIRLINRPTINFYMKWWLMKTHQQLRGAICRFFVWLNIDFHWSEDNKKNLNQ